MGTTIGTGHATSAITPPAGSTHSAVTVLQALVSQSGCGTSYVATAEYCHRDESVQRPFSRRRCQTPCRVGSGASVRRASAKRYQHVVRNTFAQPGGNMHFRLTDDRRGGIVPRKPSIAEQDTPAHCPDDHVHRQGDQRRRQPPEVRLPQRRTTSRTARPEHQPRTASADDANPRRSERPVARRCTATPDACTGTARQRRVRRVRPPGPTTSA